MKLRNKKTGEINKLLGTKMEMGIIWLNIQFQHREPKAYCYNSLAELNEEWEDVKPIEFSRYYLINEETGYIVTFDTEDEMRIFEHEVDGWKPVKVLLDGEKYTIDRIQGETNEPTR